MSTPIRKPGIELPKNIDRGTYKCLEDLKENIEILTGVRSGVPALTQLATTATLAQVVTALNGIIVRLNAQGG